MVTLAIGDGAGESPQVDASVAASTTRSEKAVAAPVASEPIPDGSPAPSPAGPSTMEQVVAGLRVADARTTSGTVDAAEWGARGRIRRLSGGLIRVRPSAAESRHREEQVRVLRSFQKSQFVLVASPKGGVGKTPTTLGLAATLGYYRGGYVLAWDNNETRGTLGHRAEAGLSAGGSAVDLLGQIDSFLTASASVGQLGPYVRPQSAHFDVLASDETPGRQQMIDGAGFRALNQALSRWYRLTVVDTGNNVLAPNWQEAVRAAHGLVVPTTVQADSANAGLWMLEHLQAVGARLLVQNAVVVVTCADPRTDRQLLSQIVDTYREVVRDVVVIPFDPVIQPGTRISYKDLAESTRRAYLTAAVAVVDALAATEKAIHQARVHQIPAQLVRGGGE